jgi:hypothetical protein
MDSQVHEIYDVTVIIGVCFGVSMLTNRPSCFLEYYVFAGGKITEAPLVSVGESDDDIL